MSHVSRTKGRLAEMTEQDVTEYLPDVLEALGLQMSEIDLGKNSQAFRYYASRTQACCSVLTKINGTGGQAAIERYMVDGQPRYRVITGDYLRIDRTELAQELSLQISEKKLRKEGYRRFNRVREQGGRVRLQVRA